MSNCSEHKKDLFGQSDMKLVAEAIGDLHYETLAQLILQLSIKLLHDSDKDKENGRQDLAADLESASYKLRAVYNYIQSAWQISKPFMESNKTIKT